MAAWDSSTASRSAIHGTPQALIEGAPALDTVACDCVDGDLGMHGFSAQQNYAWRQEPLIAGRHGSNNGATALATARDNRKRANNALKLGAIANPRGATWRAKTRADNPLLPVFQAEKQIADANIDKFAPPQSFADGDFINRPDDVETVHDSHFGAHGSDEEEAVSLHPDADTRQAKQNTLSRLPLSNFTHDQSQNLAKKQSQNLAKNSAETHIGLYFGIIFITLIALGNGVSQAVDLMTGRSPPLSTVRKDTAGASIPTRASPYSLHLPSGSTLYLDITETAHVKADEKDGGKTGYAPFPRLYPAYADLLARHDMSLVAMEGAQIYQSPFGLLALSNLTAATGGRDTALCVGFAGEAGQLIGALCAQGQPTVGQTSTVFFKPHDSLKVSSTVVSTDSLNSNLARELACTLPNLLKDKNAPGVSEALRELKATTSSSAEGHWPVLSCLGAQ